MARKASVTRLPQPQTLLEHVEAAVKQMQWLGPSDGAMVELARRYAKAIDDTVRIAEELDELAVDNADKDLMKRVRALEALADVGKVAGWLGPHLANTLKALGGAPAERAALGVEESVRGRLAELRAARQRDA